MGAAARRRRHECLFGGRCEVARLRDIGGSSPGPRTAECPLIRLPTLRRTSLSVYISSYRYVRRTSFGGVESSTPRATVACSRVVSSATGGLRCRQDSLVDRRLLFSVTVQFQFEPYSRSFLFLPPFPRKIPDPLYSISEVKEQRHFLLWCVSMWESQGAVVSILFVSSSIAPTDLPHRPCTPQIVPCRVCPSSL